VNDIAAPVSSQQGLGRSLNRLEDARLLTGRGSFMDDLNLPGELHAHMLRSPHAHARIRAIDTAAARHGPGVVAVLTGADLAADGAGIVAASSSIKNKDGTPIRLSRRPALAIDRARHVGDTVALVVAESLDAARNAAEAIEVDYELLPSVVDAAAAAKPGAPLVWDHIPANVALDWQMGDKAAVDAAFARAAHVTRLDIWINRLVVAAMEPRGAIGQYDRLSGRYTIITPTQGGSPVQQGLAGDGLGVAMGDVRVITPQDVGGGFGMKSPVFPEQVLVCWAARRLGRPVKWYGDRSDAFQTDGQARDHRFEAALALDGDGRFLAIRTRVISNMGAYMTPSGAPIPTEGGTRMLSNVYRIPAVHSEALCVYTHTTPIVAYRGAGKPEFGHVVERLVDMAARELNMDPAELRRLNMIKPADMPYATPTGLVYDSGDFAGSMDKALALADRAGFAQRRALAEAEGKLRGFGFCVFTEPDGYKDGRVSMTFDPTGMLTLTMTAQDNGQGHWTTFAQVVADRLGVPVEKVRVVQGDTDRVGFGLGTGGSRVATVAGSAIYHGALEIVEKGKRIAAHMLEAAAADIEFKDGRFTIAGTDRGLDILAVAKAAFDVAKVPPPHGLGLEASYHYAARAYSYSSGCHVAEVEIDRETGHVRLARYLLVGDYGTVINPKLLEGQLHGGIIQGVGQILWEDCRYDPDSGQLLTGSFMDYCMPRASDMPDIVMGWNHTRCLTNPLGIKGVGESGSTAAMPAVMNAVIDALAPYGAREIEMPVTAEKVWRVLEAGK
jgi:aerobic carbon-monoxide dehydrogenase large subunit